MRGQLHAVRPQRPSHAAEHGILPLLPGAVGAGGAPLPAPAGELERLTSFVSISQCSNTGLLTLVLTRV